MKAELTFEKALARLEQIVAQLDAGDLPLEEALKLFDEGSELGRCCCCAYNVEQDSRRYYRYEGRNREPDVHGAR
jgi:exodeoxyribonuclease VII small subunit